MKILIVHNRYQIPGGEDQVAAQEAELLRAHGHQVFTYSRDNGELKTFSLRQKLALPFWTLYNPKTYRDICRLVRENRIDVVHVHNTLMLVSPAVYYGALRGGAAVVQTIHNFRLLCPGATFYRDDQVCEDCLKKGLSCALKHKCYRGSFSQTLCCVLSMKLHRATGIYKKLTYICLTEFNKQKLLSLKGLSPEQVFVKPNSVEPAKKIMPWESRERQILYVGRLEERKGVKVLLESWRRLGPQAPTLVLCGSGPLESWCGDFVRENGLKNVKSLGFVENSRVREMLSESMAMILPTQLYEGFPISIAEAFSAGTPVLVSRLGNAGSLVEEGVTGLKFDQEDPDSIARTVRAFLEEKRDWSKAALEKYRGELTPEENYRRLLETYERAVASK